MNIIIIIPDFYRTTTVDYLSGDIIYLFGNINLNWRRSLKNAVLMHSYSSKILWHVLFAGLLWCSHSNELAATFGQKASYFAVTEQRNVTPNSPLDCCVHGVFAGLSIWKYYVLYFEMSKWFFWLEIWHHHHCIVGQKIKKVQAKKHVK